MARARSLRLISAASVLLAAVVVVLVGLSGGGEDRTVPGGLPPGAKAPPVPVCYRILDPNDAPVTGARVAVFAESSFRLAPEPVASVVTGPKGEVRLPARAPVGEAEVLVVRSPGKAPAVLRPDPGESVLHLSLSREVKGVVTDLAGRPIPGARVVAPSQSPIVASTVADGRGRFDLGRLPEDMTIRAEAAGRAPLDVPLGLYPDTEAPIWISLAPGHRVEGRVVDSRGEPVPGAIVTLQQESFTKAVSGKDGRFVFDGVLPDWEVLLTPFATGFVGETSDPYCGAEDVRLTLCRPASASGRVVSGRTGFPLVDFQFLDRSVTPGPDGTFHLENLLPGPLSLSVASGALSGSLSVEISEGDSLTGLRIPLFPPRWVPDGSVVAAWPVTVKALDARSGAPISGLRVSSPETGDHARTGKNGTLTVLLPAGRHRLVLGGTLEAYHARSVVLDVPAPKEVGVRLDPNPRVTVKFTGGPPAARGKVRIRSGDEVVIRAIRAGAAVVPATPGTIADLRARVESCLETVEKGVVLSDEKPAAVPLTRGAFIRGRCVGPAGYPLAKVVAEVEDLPPETQVETAGDGRFSIGPLRPGRHRFLVSGRNSRTYRATVVVPKAGINLGDLRMPGPAVLHVRVTTSSGTPIPGALVTTTFRVAAKGLTNREGRIDLPGTEPEEEVDAKAPGFLPGWANAKLSPKMQSLDLPITLLRPARLLVRTVDGEGGRVRVELPDRDDLDATRAGKGEILLDRLVPGELVLDLRDAKGRHGTLHRAIAEGEHGVATVVVK